MSDSSSSARAPVVLHWFRDDLRLTDNPALAAAALRGPVVALYVLETDSPELRPLGGAAKWWLDKSLRRLAEAISGRGGRLLLRRGSPDKVVPALVAELRAASVSWNRRYGAERAIDERVHLALKQIGVPNYCDDGGVLMHPTRMLSESGKPLRVFSPFWRTLSARVSLGEELAGPRLFTDPEGIPSDNVDDWALHPSHPDWSGGLEQAWRPGEAGALNGLQRFIGDALSGYEHARDRPDVGGVSRLSPHLRFGEIGPRQVWRSADAALRFQPHLKADVEKFLRELGWREFARHTLFHDPTIVRKSIRVDYDELPWRQSPSELRAWTEGRTGYPIVDAGMRELWRTGWMHNRVRMIVASFLVKDLLISWKEGEAWFWDTLVDADPASNAVNWQWVAGAGIDTAPWFRIFNPVLQGEKFDPEGEYVRLNVPELRHAPAEFIHKPWAAPPEVLASAGVILGETYPFRMVDHAQARKRALAMMGGRSS